jgi:hypothetical protein
MTDVESAGEDARDEGAEGRSDARRSDSGEGGVTGSTEGPVRALLEVRDVARGDGGLAGTPRGIFKRCLCLLSPSAREIGAADVPASQSACREPARTGDASGEARAGWRVPENAEAGDSERTGAQSGGIAARDAVGYSRAAIVRLGATGEARDAWGDNWETEGAHRIARARGADGGGTESLEAADDGRTSAWAFGTSGCGDVCA